MTPDHGCVMLDHRCMTLDWSTEWWNIVLGMNDGLAFKEGRLILGVPGPNQ